MLGFSILFYKQRNLETYSFVAIAYPLALCLSSLAS